MAEGAEERMAETRGYGLTEEEKTDMLSIAHELYSVDTEETKTAA